MTMTEYLLVPIQLFNGNKKKDEIDEEILRLYIQIILKQDTSNDNINKYKLKFCNVRKSISTRARAITKQIIIQEVSKYSITEITEFRHVIEWYKKSTTREEDKLQCLYTVFTREVIQNAIDTIMEAEKVKYLDEHALPTNSSVKKKRSWLLRRYIDKTNKGKKRYGKFKFVIISIVLI